jgi:hypothetical protein
MPERKNERQSDPRGLSDEKAGRSKIQDEVPPLPPADAVQRNEDAKRNKVVTKPPADGADLERREARGRGAMPFGTNGSRKGKLAGGAVTEEDRQHM